MRNQPVDILFVHIVRPQRLVNDASQCPYCDLEDLVALHLHEGTAAANQIISPGNTRRHMQQALFLTIGVKMCGEDTGHVAGFQYDGPRAITKQDAGGSVLPVGNTRERFGPHDQSPFGCASTDELVGHRQGIDKT